MSAADTFESFTASLSVKNRELLKDFIRLQRTELLAARSEDARTRIVQSYVAHIHDLLHEEK